MPTKQGRTKKFIEKIVPKFMQEAKIPGLSIAVVKEDEILIQEGFGTRNIDKNLPTTPDTLCSIGSCTKSFVALAILQLVEEGKIKLDDLVSKYLPLELEPAKDTVAIHHLLSHSSGIPCLGTALIEIGRGLGEETGVPWGSISDFYRHLNNADSEITFEPGNHYYYFNAGYSMLGHLIEKISGLSFEKYINSNILKPLAMKRSTLYKKEYAKDPNKMTPYLRTKNEELEPKELPYPNIYQKEGNMENILSFTAAAGGILSSVNELTNYLTLYTNEGTFNGTRIITSESLEKMQKIHTDMPPRHFGKRGYGYGWSITKNFFGQNFVAHSGSIIVSTAYLSLLPKQNLGIAMLSNAGGFPYEAVAQGIFASLLNKNNPEELIPGLQIKEKMKELTGTYETYKGLKKVEVIKKHGLLYLKRRNAFSERTVPLIPKDSLLKNREFYILSEEVKQPIKFEVLSPNEVNLYVERDLFHKVES